MFTAPPGDHICLKWAYVFTPPHKQRIEQRSLRSLGATNHHERQPTLRYHDEMTVCHIPWIVFLSHSCGVCASVDDENRYCSWSGLGTESNFLSMYIVHCRVIVDNKGEFQQNLNGCKNVGGAAFLPSSSGLVLLSPSLLGLVLFPPLVGGAILPLPSLGRCSSGRWCVPCIIVSFRVFLHCLFTFVFLFLSYFC